MNECLPIWACETIRGGGGGERSMKYLASWRQSERDRRLQGLPAAAQSCKRLFDANQNGDDVSEFVRKQPTA